MNSEMLGLSYLQIALGKTDHLVAHINSNDKEPSWDGDVEVYRKAGHVHAKADLILKVPVQVKGHCKPNLKKKSIKYSIQYADLKNYLAIGGTIFFVIYINDSGDKAAIYYVDLLPYDLKKHLKAYDGDPYKYLKTYRCTCTVGRSRYSLFDFSYENLTNYRPVAVTCNSYAECKDCKIGGFCGGGCQLSHQIDFKKCCTYEEEVFSHFMKTLFIPYIKSKYNEVNQNERKAENRCT